MNTRMTFDNYIIRLIRIDDIDKYYEYAFEKPDKEVMYYTGTIDEFNRDQISSYVNRVVNDSTRNHFIISSDSEIIGEVVLSEMNNKSCHYRICIFDSVNFSKGIGRKATKLIFDYVFDELDFDYVELEVFPFNERGIAVYRKLGFVEEQRIVDDDAEEPYRDIILMRLQRDDYKSQK